MRTTRMIVCAIPLTSCLALAARAESPFATEVVSYTPGAGAAAGFTNPQVALGSPERFTGEMIIPGAVTPFQPAFRPDEIVSIGTGGSLVVRFDHDVLDHPRNPHGVDLIVFGNAFFTDSGGGVVAGLAAEGGAISVSADGVQWIRAAGLDADGLFPTLGYLDAGPYATTPGSVESDFLRPVDPSLTMSDLVGLDHAALVKRYDGSGGGTGVDIGALGLSSVRFVKIQGPSLAGVSPEIDAFSDVDPLPPNADLDGDGAVGASDLAQVLAAWGTADPAADLDASGAVDSADIAFVLSAWGGTP
jgi:hypothetical protein